MEFQFNIKDESAPTTIMSHQLPLLLEPKAVIPEAKFTFLWHQQAGINNRVCFQQTIPLP